MVTPVCRLCGSELARDGSRSESRASSLPPGHGTAGFSLVELLVVIGIIVIMIGALGLALRGGGGNVALQSAQGTVNSLLAAARGQSALKQSPAYLLVNSDPASDGFLREIRIVVKVHDSASNTDTWTATGEPSYLPSGVFVVPGATLPSGVTFDATWKDSRRSSLGETAVYADPATHRSDFLVSSFSFESGGTFNDGGTIKLKIVLAPGRRTSATALVFDNPELVRGVALSAYGAPILINHAAGFDN